jgi:hypothetical protein
MEPSSVKKFRRRRAHHRRILFGRFARGVLFAGILIMASLALGVLGYHFIAGLDLIESILNASMILTGMGPVAPLDTAAGKLFASFYALFSGLAFVTASGILLTPMLQNLLRRLHIQETNPPEEDKDNP